MKRHVFIIHQRTVVSEKTSVCVCVCVCVCACVCVCVCVCEYKLDLAQTVIQETSVDI